MSNDPINRLPSAFGTLMSRLLRGERRVTYQGVATALGLPDQLAVVEMECGRREPTLSEFFRLASLLSEPPAVLFVQLVAAWRTEPGDAGNYKSRASGFARLYRLGYHHKLGDFRELATSYYSVPEATHSAVKLNAQRHSRGVALLDTACVYVRLDSVSLRPDKGQGEGRQP